MKKIALALLVTGLLVAPAYAQGPDMPAMEHHDGHGRHGAGPEKMMGKGMGMQMGMGMGLGSMEKMDEFMGLCLQHADEIGLSKEQIAKMKPTHLEMKKKQIRFQADLKIAELELLEVMEVRDFELEKATAAVKKIADLKTAHILEMLPKMKEMRGMLTDDQFEKLRAMGMKMGMKNKPGAMGMKKK